MPPKSNRARRIGGRGLSLQTPSGKYRARPPGSSWRDGWARGQGADRADILLHKEGGGAGVAGAGVGAIGVGLAQRAIGIELAEDGSEAVCVIGTEVKGGVAPDFTEAGDIVGNDGTARECGIKRGHAKRLVARGGGVDRGAAIEGAKLSVGLRATDGDGGLQCGNFNVGTNGDARNWYGLFRAHDADGKGMGMLGEQEDLFAGID